MLQNLFNENQTPNLTVLGWGSLSEGGSSAKVLNYVKLPYIDHGTCKAAMNPYEVFDGMLCAGDIELGKIDACQGDSGGPIVYRKVSGKQKSSANTFSPQCNTNIFDYSNIQISFSSERIYLIFIFVPIDLTNIYSVDILYSGYSLYI